MGCRILRRRQNQFTGIDEIQRHLQDFRVHIWKINLKSSTGTGSSREGCLEDRTHSCKNDTVCFQLAIFRNKDRVTQKLLITEAEESFRCLQNVRQRKHLETTCTNESITTELSLKNSSTYLVTVIQADKHRKLLYTRILKHM